MGCTHNPSKKHKKIIPSLPVDSKCNTEVNHCTYRISGIVYLKSHHYFCEVYSTQRNKSGWYVYNGLWNNGKATFVGSRPLFLEKESLYLLMFEKIKSNNHANNDGVSTTFYRPIHSNNNEIMKDIINKHKVLLSLPDNKVKLDNIRAILHYHNISTPTNIKLADLKDLLLQHCNNTESVPITFVSDHSMENYAEAEESEHSVTHEQDTCVLEIKSFKRIDLTPTKQG